MQQLKWSITIVFIWVGLFFNANKLHAQQSIHISGTVINNMTQKGVEDVSLSILPLDSDVSTSIGISTNKEGKFDFHFNFKVPFRIKVEHISFFKQEITVQKYSATDLHIELVPKVIKSEDLVVTAALISQEELANPVTVDKITTVDIKQLASFSTYDLISTLREVDVATQSMTMQSVNTRGFNASANKRFLQLTNDVDNRAPGLSFPIGNLMSPPGIDVSSVEVLPGPASAKYGSSALNGVLLTKTRDPFLDEGLSLTAKGGVNDFALEGRNFFSARGNGLYDFAGRFAKSFWDKLAVKVTAEFRGGTDWKAENFDNIGPGALNDMRSEQPGYNGVNVYGDEGYAYLPVGSEDLGTNYGAQVPVARTGYKESELVDYDITTRKFSGALHYKLAPDYRLVMGGRYGFTNGLYTGDTRVRLEGFEIYQGKIRMDFGNFNLLGYTTWQNSGNSYDVSILADNLISSAKSDENWYRDYRIAFRRGVGLFGISANDYEEARKFADSEVTLIRGEDVSARYKPGTKRFEEKTAQIKNSTDYNKGAAIRDNSQLYHLQTAYNIEELLLNTDLELGGDFRLYDINSNGTVFPDTTSNNITNYEFGGYISLSSSLLDQNLNIQSSVRIDKNENFGYQLSPTVAFSYSKDKKNYFRFSYQNGFRYPGLREQFLNKDLGNARLVGGLPEVVGQYHLAGNSITTQAIDEFNSAVVRDMNKSPYYPKEYSRPQAELNNLSILEEGILKAGAFNNIETEIANTFEVGYKRVITKNLYFDLNYYVSLYNNFIGITRVVKPRTSPSLDIYEAAGQINASTEHEKFYVYSNADGRLMVHGLSFNIEYLSGGFMTGLNGTYTNLLKDSEDPIVPGFNTPPLKLNFEWGHRNITDRFGFKMVYRLRSKYEWRSPFVDGTIDTYGHFDFQFNLALPSVSGNLKFGVTNWGIEKYYNIYGGPSIGSILFATYTFDPNIF